MMASLPIHGANHPKVFPVHPVKISFPMLATLNVITWLRNHRFHILCFTGGILMPIVLPLFHLGIFYKLWEIYAVKVDRNSCSCSCWDTVFKANYETGVSGYKHVYFNTNMNTLKIWTVTCIATIALYETTKRTIFLVCQKQIRFSMLILMVSIIYSHYYSWWSYFNYWNDDFYKQWNHQLFFSITEVASTIIVVYLLDSNVPVSPRKLLFIIDIAILHILASGFDQFVSNVLKAEGGLHQILRDLGLMLPDVLHVVLPLGELVRYARRLGIPPLHSVTTPDFIGSVLFVLFMWMLCLNL
ncbi:uncharacterized protein LOC106474854 [Limulus polyphemus]|uniref:Uncharacterized protein LOC106474854 n=1 Tax=Limulus polyphemus TaxID=6850 RepID=A0ABM1BYC6_LIMPO|nr:uncharacterized protein LOC106474854 [Limulus polyphemus]XP_013791005.1 uncharacterized protein LOC106474854 [Limulus polyphemus]